jgi:hypothetical protein
MDCWMNANRKEPRSLNFKNASKGEKLLERKRKDPTASLKMSLTLPLSA